MKLLIIGVNHKTAPIALRERLAFANDELSVALTQLKTHTESCIILSTCNRTEIYALLADTDYSTDQEVHLSFQDSTGYHFYESIEKIKHWLVDYKSISLEELTPYLYVYCAQEALTHWIRVATGLDSMIVGEADILGQLKQSINQSLKNGNINNQFGWAIEQIFSSAKQVRHETKIGSQAVTLGFAIAKLSSQVFEDLSKCHLLVIATGAMNRLVASHLAGQKIGKITLCNRNRERAVKLSEELSVINPNCIIEVITFTEMPQYLPYVDIVSSCSGSMNTLINLDTSRHLLEQRSPSPMLIIDLAVPRDIDDDINNLKNIHLYTIDDLQYVIADNLEQRKQAAVEAEVLVSQLVIAIEQKLQVREVGSDIDRYRQSAHQQADKLLTESLQRLKQNNGSAETILTEFSRKLTQILTHPPSKLIRKMACEGESEALEMVVKNLTSSYRK